MAFAVIARFTAKAGMEDQLIHYELVQSQKDPRQFTFFEKWESEDALTAHTQTPHVQRVRQERVPFVEGQADVSRWDVVS